MLRFVASVNAVAANECPASVGMDGHTFFQPDVNGPSSPAPGLHRSVQEHYTEIKESLITAWRMPGRDSINCPVTQSQRTSVFAEAPCPESSDGVADCNFAQDSSD